MFSKAAVALPLAASLLDQVSALSFHRHQHAAAAKRDNIIDNIVYETVVQTVYVTAGAGSSPAETAAKAFIQDVKPPTVTVAASEAPAAAPAAQTTLSTAVKPAATSTGTGKRLGFSKQGLAYNDASLANSFQSKCKGCGWGYNWASNSAGLDSSLQYIPMLWGDLPVHTSHWDADAEAAISNGAKALLSFNEPDMPAQANMAPAAAAAAHAKYFKAYNGRVQIGSPAVSNSGEGGQGLAWLQQFVDACDANSNCHYDFCAVHWYSQAQYADTLFTHLENANKICKGKPIWLTEFAPLDTSDDTISSFLKSTLPKLDSLDYLDAYSYFMVNQPTLMSSNTILNAVGNAYAAIAG
ncbi:Glycoside hydrolase [Cordyceps fumosorosea ARSEF 2679]|uniref:Glycoside hydrolase n=1 Tax=Cordyceps fumosorosea (strain ARSEF 2679) TaxID=1081104 RepID=A0A167S6Q7_CORFA|nr:Glycoside hydrolase [Cordyceps fumosorosea ARSEF 2679]OAA59313.1 Glycoside hydrolase [Cordyceps fumosorosea ARSEF 2679]